MAAPRNTPVEIVQTLNCEINAALADPAIAARLAELGSTAFPASAADFGKFLADETKKCHGDPGREYQAAVNRYALFGSSSRARATGASR